MTSRPSTSATSRSTTPANPTFTVSELADAVNSALRRGVQRRRVGARRDPGLERARRPRLLHARRRRARAARPSSGCSSSPTPGMRLRPLLAKHRLRLADGMKVRIFGHLDFYAPSGQLGLKMSDLDPRFTLGDLAQQRDQVLRRLAADGSLDANGRRPLSRGAAARRRRVQRRHGGVARLPRRARAQRVRVPARARRHPGPGSRRAAAGSRRAIQALSRHADRRGLDVIVVIRGGGARNELATFDAEPIARAIAAAPVPVLTGLGHEIDRSVADEVAHTSLKTPTACAAVARPGGRRSTSTAVERRYAAVVDAAPTAAGRRPSGRSASAPTASPGARTPPSSGPTSGSASASTGCAPALDRPLVDGERRAAARPPSGWSSRAPQLLAAEERHLGRIEARVRCPRPGQRPRPRLEHHPRRRRARRPLARRRRRRRRPHHPARRRLAAQPRRARRRDSP